MEVLCLGGLPEAPALCISGCSQAHALTPPGCRRFPLHPFSTTQIYCFSDYLGLPPPIGVTWVPNFTPAASRQQVQHLQTHRSCADPVGDASDPQRKNCLINTM